MVSPPAPYPPIDLQGSLMPTLGRVLAVACLLVAGACGDEGVPVEQLSAAVPGILPASTEPLLEVVDDQGEVVASLDEDGLAALGMVEATIEEPWLEEDIAFRGVWMADLLERLDLTDRTVHLHAIDDYEVTFRPGDLEPGDALLAVRADGEPIPIAEGGPIRLVFLDDGIGANRDLWIWSIDVLTAR